MTNDEIREEGWRLLRHEGWMIRLLYATVLFALIGSVFSYFLSVVYEKLGAVDFQHFASNQILLKAEYHRIHDWK